jgi:DNA helicase-2/ATP-dependent DNA helicase PcrA
VSSISASHPSASTGTGALQVGNVIEHERFGIGDVVAVVGQGDNCKATVKFHNAGEKQLLLKFAKFKVIG